MSRLEIYDPPMCCSTGVCGPAVDPALPRITADLDWLKRQGVEVGRFNLGQQPQAFIANPAVAAALREHGNECLPLVLVDGEIASRGRYPDRAELTRLVGLGAAVEHDPTPAPAPSCCSAPSVVSIGGPPSNSSECC